MGKTKKLEFKKTTDRENVCLLEIIDILATNYDTHNFRAKVKDIIKQKEKKEKWIKK